MERFETLPFSERRSIPTAYVAKDKRNSFIHDITLRPNIAMYDTTKQFNNHLETLKQILSTK